MKRIIELPSGKLEYADEGQGPALLFLHGGHSNANDRLWHKGFDPTRFRLITPSRPGYGRTPLGVNHTPGDAARLMTELLDVLKINGVVVIGISAGGYTALEMAARRPQQVEKLLLLSALTKTWLTPADALYRKARLMFRPGVEKLTWAALRTALSISPKAIAERMFGEFSTVNPGDLEASEVLELRDMLLRQSSGSGFLNDLAQLPPDPLTLARIDCPVLIQHSLNDAAVPMEHAEYALEHIPYAILKQYDNLWGHLLWLGTDAGTPIGEARAFIAGRNEGLGARSSTRLLAF